MLVIPAALLIFDGSEGPPFLILAFLIIGINRFFIAGISAAIPHVVDDRRLVTANSVATTMGSLFFAFGLGTALATLARFELASFHGYGLIASVAAVGYAASALMARYSFSESALGPDDVPPGGIVTAPPSGRASTTGVARPTSGVAAGNGKRIAAALPASGGVLGP